MAETTTDPKELEAKAIALAERRAADKWADDTVRLRRGMAAFPDQKPITFGEFLKRTNFSKAEGHDVLDTLCARNDVRIASGDAKYERVSS